MPQVPLALALAALCLSTAPRADCIDDAARHYDTSPDVLRAIAIVESRVNPAALARNPDGSADHGMYQINSVHLPVLRKYGIDERDLHDPCISSYVASLLLRRQMNRFGDTWEAIGAYNAPNSPERRRRYAGLVQPVVEFLERRRQRGAAQAGASR